MTNSPSALWRRHVVSSHHLELAAFRLYRNSFTSLNSSWCKLTSQSHPPTPILSEHPLRVSTAPVQMLICWNYRNTPEQLQSGLCMNSHNVSLKYRDSWVPTVLLIQVIPHIHKIAEPLPHLYRCVSCIPPLWHSSPSPTPSAVSLLSPWPPPPGSAELWTSASQRWCCLRLHSSSSAACETWTISLLILVPLSCILCVISTHYTSSSGQRTPSKNSFNTGFVNTHSGV